MVIVPLVTMQQISLLTFDENNNSIQCILLAYLASFWPPWEGCEHHFECSHDVLWCVPTTICHNCTHKAMEGWLRPRQRIGHVNWLVDYFPSMQPAGVLVVPRSVACIYSVTVVCTCHWLVCSVCAWASSLLFPTFSSSQNFSFSLGEINPSVSSGGTLIIVSVANKGEPDVTALVVSFQPVPELFDIVLHCINPAAHRPSTVHHKTEIHLYKIIRCNTMVSHPTTWRGVWQSNDFTQALLGYGGGLHVGTVALNFMVSTFSFNSSDVITILKLTANNIHL